MPRSAIPPTPGRARSESAAHARRSLLPPKPTIQTSAMTKSRRISDFGGPRTSGPNRHLPFPNGGRLTSA